MTRQIKYNCDYCGKQCSLRHSHYLKNKRHFCSRECYSNFRRDLLPKEEQHRYGSGLSLAERILRKKARSEINHAIQRGKIRREPCLICGVKNSQAHHPDYTRPLFVKWYCFKHHRQIHKINETPELREVKSE